MKSPVRIFLLLCCIGSFNFSKAQTTTSGGGNANIGGNEAFPHGSFILSPGIGIGYDYGYLGTFYPALILSGDYGLNANVGPGTLAVGGELGFKYGSYDYAGYDFSAGYSEIYVAGRVSYHWTPPGVAKLDLYGGIPIGFRFDHYGYWNYDYFNNDYYKVSGTTVDPLVGIYFGASYYLTSKIAVFGQVGLDISILTLGVNIKLK